MSGRLQWLQDHWSNVVTLSCLIAVGVIEALQQALSGAPSVSAKVPAEPSSTWHYIPLALLIIAGVAWLSGRHGATRGQKSTGQSVSNALVTSSPANFDATQLFSQAYNSTLNSEIETNLRLAANQNQPNDHEGFFIKLISVGLVAYVYDIAWAYIYKSQMLLLMELNRRMMPLLEVRPYYDTAAEAYPAVYKNYSFEQWLNWIKASYLIIQHPSNMVEITARGRDFLKYLVHLGRYVDDKTC